MLFALLLCALSLIKMIATFITITRMKKNRKETSCSNRRTQTDSQSEIISRKNIVQKMKWTEKKNTFLFFFTLNWLLISIEQTIYSFRTAICTLCAISKTSSPFVSTVLYSSIFCVYFHFDCVVSFIRLLLLVHLCRTNRMLTFSFHVRHI